MLSRQLIPRQKKLLLNVNDQRHETPMGLATVENKQMCFFFLLVILKILDRNASHSSSSCFYQKVLAFFRKDSRNIKKQMYFVPKSIKNFVIFSLDFHHVAFFSRFAVQWSGIWSIYDHFFFGRKLDISTDKASFCGKRAKLIPHTS